MGIELDVLVGHPEHELLFVAGQVGAAAGLREPRKSVSKYLLRRSDANGAIKLGEAIKCLPKGDINVPCTSQFRRWTEVWMASESTVYEMLTRGHAPQSEPFRRWVFDEVLPTIRKTGQYNAAESSDPIALGIMDELKLLRGELVELKGTRCSI